MRLSVRALAIVFVGGIVLIGTVVFLVPLSSRKPLSNDVSSTGSSSSAGSAAGSMMVDNTDDRRAYLQSMNSFVAEHPQDVKPGVMAAKRQSQGLPNQPVPAQLKDIHPSKIAIVQFDTRPLNSKLEDYWSVSAAHNKNYCQKHGHIFLYYSLRDKEKCMAADGKTVLADPWCKVKAMVKADEQYPHIQAFVYMDSDAVLDHRFDKQPLQNLLGQMQDKLQWDHRSKPTVFNQDGPCWWCDLVESKGYSTCLNAGTVVWVRHQRSQATLRAWWQAALDPYSGNPIRRAFRTKWPWEQDRQMALFNRTPEHIQVASQPDQMHMDMRAGHNDWCLSHLARSGCFISHYCEGKHSKLKMRERYLPESLPDEGLSSLYL